MQYKNRQGNCVKFHFTKNRTMPTELFDSLSKQILPYHSLCNVLSTSPHLESMALTASSAISKCMGMNFS